MKKKNETKVHIKNETKNNIRNIIILAIVIFIILAILPIRIKYNNFSAPSTTYTITIYKISKKMTVKEFSIAGTKDQEKITTKNKITLTNEEYEIIKKIRQKKYEKEYLVDALSFLAEDDKVYDKKGDNLYEEEDDINKDGVVTARELGMNHLKYILKGDY